MIEYIKGKLIEKNPTNLVIEAYGVGYFVNISLATYSALEQEGSDVRIFIHQIIKEDSHSYYGFINQSERAVFRKLLSVSGVGASSARMILSTRTPKEVVEAILCSDNVVFKNVKGIGVKTAEKIIIELKDKMGEVLLGEDIKVSSKTSSRSEALSALEILGFPRGITEKVISEILSTDSQLPVEQLIKLALKKL